MKLENEFEVPAPPAEAWALLNDVPRVVPCMPGAQLDEMVDEDNFKVTLRVKLGPIGLQFATDIKREAVDEAAQSTTLSAKARETKGRGGATATIESTLAPAGDGTRVTIVTDLQMQGTVASTGRGIVGDVASARRPLRRLPRRAAPEQRHDRRASAHRCLARGRAGTCRAGARQSRGWRRSRPAGGLSPAAAALRPRLARRLDGKFRRLDARTGRGARISTLGRVT